MHISFNIFEIAHFYCNILHSTFTLTILYNRILLIILKKTVCVTNFNSNPYDVMVNSNNTYPLHDNTSTFTRVKVRADKRTGKLKLKTFFNCMLECVKNVNKTLN